MFKNLKYLYLCAFMLILCFSLMPVSFAASSTSWQELGTPFPFNYTSATSNRQNGNVQLVVGFVNGVIEYYNPSTQAWINIPSPAVEGGTAVTALYCGWSNTINADGTINSNIPNILTGYADGSVWYYQANQNGSGAWDLHLVTPTYSQQVTKFGGVAIDSSNDLKRCNVETAVVPSGAVTPVSYTNRLLWTATYTTTPSGSVVWTWTCELGSGNTNISTIDANSDDCGLSDGDIQQNGGYDAHVSSNPIACTVYLGQNNNNLNEYFYGDNSGNYGIGYFSGFNSLSSQSISFGSATNNYVYTSVSPIENGNQSVIVANNALRLFNITNNYSSISSNPDLWDAPDNTSFNGLDVDWNGATPQTIIAGLTNGEILLNLGFPGYELFNAPPNFPADGTGCSQTFAGPTSTESSVAEIFNNGNSCYIYATNIAIPAAPTAQNLAALLIFTPGAANSTTYQYDLSLISSGFGNCTYSVNVSPGDPSGNLSIINGDVLSSDITDYNQQVLSYGSYTITSQLGQTATGYVYFTGDGDLSATIPFWYFDGSHIYPLFWLDNEEPYSVTFNFNGSSYGFAPLNYNNFYNVANPSSNLYYADTQGGLQVSLTGVNSIIYVVTVG